MKNTLRMLAAAMLVATASVAQAQGGRGGGMGGAERAAAARTALFEGITLTDVQKAKIDTIYANTQKQNMELRAGLAQGERPGPEMMPKMQAIQAEQQKQIKAVLTAEQVVVYDKNYANRQQMRRPGGR